MNHQSERPIIACKATPTAPAACFTKPVFLTTVSLSQRLAAAPLAVLGLTMWVALGSSMAQGATPPVAAATLKPNIFYKQKAYSSSEAVELGEETTLDARMYWDFKDTVLGLRFNTDPEKNPVDNETDTLEATLVHHYDMFDFAVDLDIDLDNSGTGGTTVALDGDSVKSFVAVTPLPFLQLSLHPYNFGGRVGKQFQTDDVNRIYFVDGTPSRVSRSPIGDETLAMKTIPGVVATFDFKPVQFYVGGGAVSFAYPSNSDFDIETESTSDRWKMRNDTGYKGGFAWELDETSHLNFAYVAHERSAKTGSLMAAANSLQFVYDQPQGAFVEFERTQVTTGEAPYKVARDSSWFADQAPFRPIYKDYYGERHTWINKTDQALSLRLGHHFGNWLPYGGYQFLGENFVYRDRDSAHRLRTADDAHSHGGLKVTLVGLTWAQGPLSLRGEVAFKRARNKVFGSTRDLRDDRLLRELRDEEDAVTIYTTYAL